MGEGMKDDGTLLTEYAANGSDDAFRELVSRHAGLVYSAAQRQVGRGSLAEEVTQAVFCILADKAAKLQHRPVVAGWLHQTTRFASLKAVRSEQRRQQREQEASLMNDGKDESAAVWSQIEPHLDAALASLGETDRDALILRYFEDQNLREVGDRLGLSEDAAQKRVSRALEKLRGFFVRRKIGLSAGVIAATLPANAIATVPAALTGAIAASASTLSLINETMNVIAWAKIKTAVPIAVIGILAAGTPITVQHNTISDLRRENADLRAWIESHPAPRPQAEVPAPGLSTDEVTKLKEDAAEVHRLRAEISRARQATETKGKELQQIRSQQDRLRQQMTQVSEARTVAEDTVARDQEKQMLARITGQRKQLGLAFRLALDKGIVPRSIDDLAKDGRLDPQQVGELRNSTIFFDHSNTQDAINPSFRIILADRQPTQTIDGERIWFFTLLDGSVIRSRVPPPADGIFQPPARLRGNAGR